MFYVISSRLYISEYDRSRHLHSVFRAAREAGVLEESAKQLAADAVQLTLNTLGTDRYFVSLDTLRKTTYNLLRTSCWREVADKYKEHACS